MKADPGMEDASGMRAIKDSDNRWYATHPKPMHREVVIPRDIAQ